jgi:hypothetical protein
MVLCALALAATAATTDYAALFAARAVAGFGGRWCSSRALAAGQMTGPWLAGLLADRTGPGASLVWTAALCGAASLVAALGPGRRQVTVSRR